MLNPKHSKFAYFYLICVIILNYYFVLCKLSIIINRCEQDLSNIIHFRYKWAFLTLNLWKISFHLTFGIINSHLASIILRWQRQSGFILKCKIKRQLPSLTSRMYETQVFWIFSNGKEHNIQRAGLTLRGYSVPLSGQFSAPWFCAHSSRHGFTHMASLIST